MKSKENLVCSICGKGPFQDRRGLMGHRAIVHGVEKRIVKDSEALKLLKELALKMDRLLVEQEQSAVDLKKIGQEIPQSMADVLTRDLTPIAGDMETVKRAVTNELPHLLKDLNAAAAQVGKVVEKVGGHIRVAGQETGQAAQGKVKGEELPEASIQQAGQDSKWGWVILAGIGGWVLWNYLKQRGAREQGAAVSATPGLARAGF